MRKHQWKRGLDRGAIQFSRLFGLSVFSLLVGCTGGEDSDSSSDIAQSSSPQVVSSSLHSTPLESSSSALAVSSVSQSSTPFTDIDLDGVVNDTDNCPETALGELVDSAGCSSFQRGQLAYMAQGCVACHGADGSGSAAFPAINNHNCSVKVEGSCGEVDSLAIYIAGNMPAPGKCTDTNSASCATDVANFMVIAFAPVMDATDPDGDGIVGAADLCPNTEQADKRSIDHTGCAQNTSEITTAFAINAGGEAYTSQNGTLFRADSDTYYSGSLGATAGMPTHAIAATEDDELFRTERWGQSLEYKIPLPAGRYTVELYMAEVFFTEAGKRIFNVILEGQLALNNYDPFVSAGGKNVAKIETIRDVVIEDGLLNVAFNGLTNNGSVLAIRVLSTSANDGDNDGVADTLEICPGTLPNAPVNNEGCSDVQRDSDGDGILSPEDICPNTPVGELASVDTSGNLTGCSESERAQDADNDGVADVIDNCNATPAGETVGATGCRGGVTLTKADPISPQIRLTEREYANTITAAFGVMQLAPATLQADTWGPFNIFTNNASDKTADFSVLVKASTLIADALAVDFAGRCNWQSAAGACVEDHLAEPLKVVYRENSLRDADVNAVRDVIVATLAVGANVQQAVASGIARALIDDRAIYRIELGQDRSASGKAALTDRELANRLSYLLLDRAPDAALVSALPGLADNRGTIETQAERLMALADYKQTVWLLMAEWLNIPTSAPPEVALLPAPIAGDQCNATPECQNQFAGLAQSYDCKNSASNTSWCACDGVRCDSLQAAPAGMSLKAAMHEETRRLVDHVVDNDLPLTELFTANYSFINAGLAEHYSVAEHYAANKPATEWARYDFPPEAKRQGILTHASFLSGNGNHGRDVNTIFRGKVVFERLFCDKMPPPPPPELSTGLADQISDRGTHPSCKGCHSVVDPIGRMFDLYDDTGKRFDSAELSGGLYMDVDIAAEYEGVVDFASAIEESQAFKQCFSQQLFRFALGRDPVASETQSFVQINDALVNEGSINAAVRALVSSDAFKHVYSENSTQACAVGE